MEISIVYHSETGNVKRMAEIIAGACEGVGETVVNLMPVDLVNIKRLEQSNVILFGSPTYCGNCSWQIKKFLDYHPKALKGKLGGVFVSQNQPGGGGASFAAMSIIAELLVCGMLVYSSGAAFGAPILHFGAIAQKSPEKNSLDYTRCEEFGKRITEKAYELFPKHVLQQN